MLQKKHPWKLHRRNIANFSLEQSGVHWWLVFLVPFCIQIMFWCRFLLFCCRLLFSRKWYRSGTLKRKRKISGDSEHCTGKLICLVLLTFQGISCLLHFIGCMDPQLSFNYLKFFVWDSWIRYQDRILHQLLHFTWSVWYSRWILTFSKGFIAFIMTLQKDLYKYQFGQLTWTLMTLLIVIGQSHFIIQNIFKGLFWYDV